MKKITLLLSAMAVVSSSFAATPEVNQNLQKKDLVKCEPTMITNQVFDGAKVFAGKEVIKDRKILKKVARKAPGFSVSYEEPEGLFALGMSEEGMGYSGMSFHFGPAYKPLTWRNTSVGATEFEWEYMTFDNEGNIGYEYASTYDLTMTPEWAEIDGPTLYGIDEEGNDANFMLGGVRDDAGEITASRIGFHFGGEPERRVSDTEWANFGQTTYLYSYNGGGYGTVPCTGYAPGQKDYNPVTGLYEVYTTPAPNGYGFTSVKLEGYANFFKAPAAPYFITKMWCSMSLQAKVPTTIEMNLYKVNDEGQITDEVIASGSLSIQPATKLETRPFTFELYALDEDGIQTDDLIVIDSAFMAEMTFNAADFVSINMVTGAGATFAADEQDPYVTNGLLMINADGQFRYMGAAYNYYTDNTYSTLMSITDWMWMVDAVYPWLTEVNDKTVAVAPNEGGEVSFVLNSYYNVTSLGLSSSDDSDWILGAYVDIDENYNQIVTFGTEALPEGVASRSAVMTLEGPAVSLDLKIEQGDGAGVSVVAVDNNAEYYDLAGRRVANPEKGIFIKKAGNKAEKVIF